MIRSLHIISLLSADMTDMWNCCNYPNLCYTGMGDCDTDDDCYGNFVCGSNNCGWYDEASSLDCCIYPEY